MTYTMTAVDLPVAGLGGDFQLACMVSAHPVSETAARALLANSQPLAKVAASSPRATPGALGVLARARNQHVRAAALTRVPDTDLLTDVARSAKPLFVAAVARNPHTPAEVLEELALGRVPEVVASAVVNPATSRAAVVAALRHGGSCAIFHTQRAPGAPSTSKSRFAAGRAVLAAHPEVVDEVARDADAGFRKAALTVRGAHGPAVTAAMFGAASHLAAAGNPTIDAKKLSERAAVHRAGVLAADATLTAGTGAVSSPVAVGAVGAASFTLDLELVDRLGGLDVAALSAWAGRQGDPALMVDGFVLARVIDRFGMAALVPLAAQTSATRFQAVGERSVLAKNLLSVVPNSAWGRWRSLVWGAQMQLPAINARAGEAVAVLDGADGAWATFLTAATSNAAVDVLDLATACAGAVAA